MAAGVSGLEYLDWTLIWPPVRFGAVVSIVLAIIAARYTGKPFAEDRSYEWRVQEYHPSRQFTRESSDFQRFATRQEAHDENFGAGSFSRSVRNAKRRIRIIGVATSLLTPVLYFIGNDVWPFAWPQGVVNLIVAEGLLLVINAIAIWISITFNRDLT